MSADQTGDRGILLQALTVQLRCISALMVRDMMQRYGRANIGFLWIVLEPLLLTAGVMIVWSLYRPEEERGVGLLTFVMTGYLPLTLWRHVTQSGVHAFRRSLALLYHRHITLLDALLARFALEFGGTTAALFTVYGVLAVGGAVGPVSDASMVLAGWLSLMVLSVGVAIVFAVLTEYSEATERFIQPIQYVILPLSGAFFMVEWLPDKAQEFALYMPTVHCYEMFRAGFLGDAVRTHYTAWYPIATGLVLASLGLASIESVRDKLHLS